MHPYVRGHTHEHSSSCFITKTLACLYILVGINSFHCCQTVNTRLDGVLFLVGLTHFQHFVLAHVKFFFCKICGNPCIKCQTDVCTPLLNIVTTTPTYVRIIISFNFVTNIERVSVRVDTNTKECTLDIPFL